MGFRSRGIALVAAGVTLALSLSACGGNSGDSGTATPGGAGASTGIIKMYGTEPQNPLIPSATNEVGGGWILTNLFAGLIYYDGKGNTKMDLADSIATSDGGTTWTVKVQSGHKFSNDDPVDANAFVDTWNWASDPANKQLNASWFSVIKGFDEMAAGTAKTLSGLKVVDDMTFTVELSNPDPAFNLQLGYSAWYPLPKSAFADMKTYGQQPIGNGPYKLASPTAWQHDQQIDLVPNPDYTGPRKPQNGGLTYIFYQSLTAAYADLQSGQLDILNTIPDDNLKTYEADLGKGAVRLPGSTFQGFTIPARLPHFAGEEGTLRRQALSMAIDRDNICSAVLNNSRTPAKDFSAPPMPGWTDQIPGNDVLTYNPDKAKQLWAQADAISPWSGTFEIAYNQDGPHAAWVEATLNSIKRVLSIETAPHPYPTFAAARKDITERKIEVPFRSGWQPDYPSMYNYLFPLYGTGGSSNDGDYSNPDFDKLLAQGVSQTDQAKAVDYYTQAQSILMKDLPAIPLWYQNLSAGQSTAVSNVEWGWDNVPIAYLITKSA